MPQFPGDQPYSNTAHAANAAIRGLALAIGRRTWTTAELAWYAELNEIWLAAMRESERQPADTGMTLAA